MDDMNARRHQQQQAQFMEEQSRLMQQQTKYMQQQAMAHAQYQQGPYGFAPQPAQGYGPRFHWLWFLLVGWWLAAGIASFGVPLLLLLFGWGRKMWFAVLGYW